MEEQNRQLAQAKSSEGRKRHSRYGGKDLGSAVVLPGKQFDTWRYETPDNQLLEIPVRVVKQSRKGEGRGRGQDKALGTEQTYFQVVLPNYAINEIDTDIERLRQTVWKLLEVPFQIEWKPYLRIEFTAADHNLVFAMWEQWELPEKPLRHRNTDYGVEKEPRLNGKFELSLEIEEWELGTTKDGRQVSRIIGKGGSRWEPEVRKGWPEVETENGGWFGDRVKVLIPHTAENEAALIEILRNLTVLKARLQTITRPDMIEKHFALAASKFKMLPAPGPAPKGKGKT